MRQGGNSALWTAASEGNADFIEQIRLDVQEVVNLPENNATPLWIAAKNGHKDAVNSLLEIEGIDCNWVNFGGESALNAAAEEGHKEVVALLLKHADANLENEDGATALYIASENGHLDIAKLLLPHSNPNAVNRNGATPLYIASERGHLEIVKLLLPKTNPLLLDMDGWTPLHVASYSGHADIVRFFLDSNAFDLSLETNGGDSALQLALDEGHDKVGDILRGYQDKSNAKQFPRLWIVEAVSGSGVFPRGHLLREKQVILRAIDGVASIQLQASSPIIQKMLPMLKTTQLIVHAVGLLQENNLVWKTFDHKVALSEYGVIVQSLSAMTWLYGNPPEYSMDNQLQSIISQLETGILTSSQAQELNGQMEALYEKYLEDTQRYNVLIQSNLIQEK